MFKVASALILMVVMVTATQAQEAFPEPVVYHGTEKMEDWGFDDPEIKDLEWHRWTTENFTVLALEEDQGLFMARNIEKIKTWVMKRWGFPNVDFSSECRVICVPTKTLMKKLFRIEDSRAEVRKESNKITMSAVWLLLDDSPSEVVPECLTTPCLSEFDQKHGLRLRTWVYRGVSRLNNTVPLIRTQLAMLREHKELFFSKAMFAMDEDGYMKLSKEEKELFDTQSLALCLLIRKEFGQDVLHEFMKSSSDPDGVLRRIGFNGYSQFDASYLRYMKDLNADILNSKTPDSYLDIKPK